MEEFDKTKPHVACKNCVFAKYDGNTQVGCELGRTSKFKKLGALIEAKDNNKEFFIVNGRICNAYRDKDWVEHIVKNHSMSAIKKKLKSEIDVTVDLVIMIEKDYKVADLEHTLDSLKNIKKPKQILVALNTDVIHPYEVLKILREKENEIPPFKLIKIQEEGISREGACDILFKDVNSRFYSVFKAGATIPNDFFNAINTSINVIFDRFVILEPYEDGNGLTVLSDFHKHPNVMGNYEIEVNENDLYDAKDEEEIKPLRLHNVVEKAIFYGKLYKQDYLIKKAEDICPNQS